MGFFDLGVNMNWFRKNKSPCPRKGRIGRRRIYGARAEPGKSEDFEVSEFQWRWRRFLISRYSRRPVHLWPRSRKMARVDGSLLVGIQEELFHNFRSFKNSLIYRIIMSKSRNHQHYQQVAITWSGKTLDWRTDKVSIEKLLKMCRLYHWYFIKQKLPISSK